MPTFTRRPFPPSSVISIGPFAKTSLILRSPSTSSASLIRIDSSGRRLTTNISHSLEGIERKACVDGASCAAEHAALTGRLPRACRIVERDVRAAQQPQGGQYLLAAGLDARTVARVLGLPSFGQVEQALPASAERLRRRGRRAPGEGPPLALERIERLDETHLFRSGIV